MRVGPYLVYVAGALVAGATLTWPIWNLVAALGVRVDRPESLTLRLCELCALFGLIPLLRWLGAPGAAPWGFVRGGAGAPGIAAGLARGLLAGVLMLLPVALVLLALGVRAPAPGWSHVALLPLAGKAALSGVAVALLEEAWYRGGLQGALMVRFPTVPSVAVVTALYAAGHFVRTDVHVAAGAGWTTGFLALAGSFHRFASLSIVDSFVALAAAGAMLSIVRLRTGRLWECIGIHAGWVIVIKVLRGLTQPVPGVHWSWLAGRYDGVIGWLVAGWFVVVIAGYAWTTSRARAE